MPKYLVLVPDGMADYSCPALGGKTPMQAARKPYMDALASASRTVGIVHNVPDGMVPESDTANLSILGYDPAVYSKGRSPLEALSMGVKLGAGDVAFRCNLVHLSPEQGEYDDKIMVDHSSDEITTAEADLLIKALQEHFGTAERRFHTGVSYRHLMVWHDPPSEGDKVYNFMRPHDILGQRIAGYLPSGAIGEHYRRIMEESSAVLSVHPVNLDRGKRGLRTANSAWFWSPGTKPALPSFIEKTGLRGSVISAVDLIKGIGICAGMESIDVEGATGNIDTNFPGKARAATEAFERGSDFVFVHMEAPDECGHRAETEKKVRSIELIDELVVGPVWDYLRRSGEPYRILLLPDHPTPIVKRTHTMEGVPFLIYDSADVRERGGLCFDERVAPDVTVPNGHELLKLFL